jgi:hypothetical protein
VFLGIVQMGKYQIALGENAAAHMANNTGVGNITMDYATIINSTNSSLLVYAT